MKRVFRSLKTGWAPNNRYGNIGQVMKEVSYYLIRYYNAQRRHQYNWSLTPIQAEKQLSNLSGNS